MEFTSKFKRSFKNIVLNMDIIHKAHNFTKRRIVILRYHSVKDNPSLHEDAMGNGIIHSSDCFKEQMSILAKSYDPMSIDDVLSFLNGDCKLPKRPVVVSFDDGYADNSEIAQPILDKYGIKGIFYITVDALNKNQLPWFVRLRYTFNKTNKIVWNDQTSKEELKLYDSDNRNKAFLQACRICGCLTGEEQEKTIQSIEQNLDVSPFNPQDNLMLTWDQVRAMHSSGHTIGSHSLSHPNIAQVSTNEMKKEIIESKRIIEKELSSQIFHFSYPNPVIQPHWSLDSQKEVKKAGYKTATTSNGGAVHLGDNPLSLKRIWVSSHMDEFKWKLENVMLGRQP